MNEGWSSYFEATKGRPPQRLLMEGANYVPSKGAALDLGSGALQDTIFLLKIGFGHVIALDQELVAAEVAGILPSARFSYLQSTFEEFVFPERAFELVNAQYALPFVDPQQFDRVFRAIVASLKPGGIFTGQIFGDRDEWSDDPGMNFHPINDARAIFSSLDLLEFREDEGPGKTAMGDTKHWHVFHVIARKP